MLRQWEVNHTRTLNLFFPVAFCWISSAQNFCCDEAEQFLFGSGSVFVTASAECQPIHTLRHLVTYCRLNSRLRRLLWYVDNLHRTNFFVSVTGHPVSYLLLTWGTTLHKNLLMSSTSHLNSIHNHCDIIPVKIPSKLSDVLYFCWKWRMIPSLWLLAACG